MNIWKSVNNPELGLLDSLSSYIGELEAKGDIVFPNLGEAKSLYVLSDYGGEHKTANFFCYTFLLIDSEELKPFCFFQSELRKQFNLGDRVIEFKKLNDNVRLKALDSFLRLSNHINGIIVSVLVHKDIKGLFYENFDLTSENLKQYAIWKDKTFEKIIRITNLIGLFIGGLSTSMQNLCWITDEDDIVIDNNKLTILTELFAKITTQYLHYDLGHLRCGRTNIEKNSKFFEDLCSLADLTSGAFVSLFTEHQKQHTLPRVSKLIVPAPQNTKQKVVTIGGWLADKNPKIKLKKLCLMMKMGENNQINFSNVKFHNLNDYVS